MYTLYGGKMWAEMTSEEQKVTLIVMGIMLLVLIAYGIYSYFKKKKDKEK